LGEEVSAGAVSNVRPFRRSDVPVILSLLNEADDLWKFGSPYWRRPSEADLMALCGQVFTPGKSDRIDLLITAADDIPVGQCSLHAIDWRNRVAEVGVAVWRRADRGLGHGSSAVNQIIRLAFDELDLARLEALVLRDNTDSIKLFLRSGFEQEGMLRQRYRRKGERVDVVVCARLRAD
jgi:RimJ/RimL family protein N-acetyltransferase